MNFNHRLTQIALIKSSIEHRASRNGFTLIELVIAVAILAMVLSFAGVIFRVSIETYRASVANAEIMQKLRAITDQLNADFKGLRLDAPLLIRFNQDSSPDDPNRYDQIMFFADGDFTSIQLYDEASGEPDDKTGDKLVRGNVARIHYAQAQPDPNLLARRRHILTADPDLDDWPGDISMTDFNDCAGAYKLNEWYEHDRLSLSEWKTIEGRIYKHEIIPVCLRSNNRALIDMEDPNTFHKLMCDGVASFAVQWAYPVSGKFYWFPSDDPNGDGSIKSHFDLMDSPRNEKFGVYFNIPNGSDFVDSSDFVVWYFIGVGNVEYDSGKKFLSDFYPEALKFTFTLYDSRGVIKKGREFTHIVYLEN